MPLSSPSSVSRHTRPAARGSVPAATVSVAGALRMMEAILLRGGRRTAVSNAWTAVLQDRERARGRLEAQRLLEALGTPGGAFVPSHWGP